MNKGVTASSCLRATIQVGRTRWAKEVNDREEDGWIDRAEKTTAALVD